MGEGNGGVWPCDGEAAAAVALSRRSLRLWRNSSATRPSARSAMSATPPTAPPMIGPSGVELLGEGVAESDTLTAELVQVLLLSVVLVVLVVEVVVVMWMRSPLLGVAGRVGKKSRRTMLRHVVTE